MTKITAVALGMMLAVALAALPVAAQTGRSAQPATQTANPPAPPAGAPLPPGYVIGADDVLTIQFWRDKDMSGDVVVRPDGKITLPLVNDLQAAGLSPDQLRDVLTKAAAKFVEDPNVTVIVKAINSRKVYITGMVAKAGAYPLAGPTTVIQALTMAGGIQEFADSKNIMILRTEAGKQVSFRFNYKDVSKGKNLKQNIELKPGDSIIVP